MKSLDELNYWLNILPQTIEIGIMNFSIDAIWMMWTDFVNNEFQNVRRTSESFRKSKSISCWTSKIISLFDILQFPRHSIAWLIRNYIRLSGKLRSLNHHRQKFVWCFWSNLKISTWIEQWKKVLHFHLSRLRCAVQKKKKLRCFSFSMMSIERYLLKILDHLSVGHSAA